MGKSDSRNKGQTSATPLGSANVGRSEVSLTLSGPLPVSSEFANYERTLPGTADRLLTMVEKEQAHRHEMELKECEIRAKSIENDNSRLNLSLNAGKAEIKLAGRGQIFVFALFFLFVAAILVSLYLKSQLFATVFGVALFMILYSSGFLSPPKNDRGSNRQKDR